MVPGNEQRGETRAPIELKIEYKSLNTFFSDYTANLSARGTFIRTETPLPIGTEFNFKLNVPQLTEPIALRGIVRWARQKKASTNPEEVGMGIEFLFDNDAQFDALRAMVEGLMKATLGESIAGRLLTKTPLPNSDGSDPNLS